MTVRVDNLFYRVLPFVVSGRTSSLCGRQQNVTLGNYPDDTKPGPNILSYLLNL